MGGIGGRERERTLSEAVSFGFTGKRLAVGSLFAEEDDGQCDKGRNADSADQRNEGIDTAGGGLSLVGIDNDDIGGTFVNIFRFIVRGDGVAGGDGKRRAGRIGMGQMLGLVTKAFDTAIGAGGVLFKSTAADGAAAVRAERCAAD